MGGKKKATHPRLSFDSTDYSIYNPLTNYYHDIESNAINYNLLLMIIKLENFAVSVIIDFHWSGTHIRWVSSMWMHTHTHTLTPKEEQSITVSMLFNILPAIYKTDEAQKLNRNFSHGFWDELDGLWSIAFNVYKWPFIPFLCCIYEE